MDERVVKLMGMQVMSHWKSDYVRSWGYGNDWVVEGVCSLEVLSCC